MSPLPPPFTVHRLKQELLAPLALTPRELKPLSDIDDQEGFRWDIPILCIYGPNPSMIGRDPVKVIKSALVGALAFYYPLAGRLVERENKKLLVDCNAEGVVFIEAKADVKLEELGDAILPPCPNLEALIYAEPEWEETVIGRPLLSFQVTRLKCGGFILGINICHSICDGGGFYTILKGIQEIAVGARAPSTTPIWERETLNAHSPPRVTCKHYEFEDPKAPPNTNWSTLNWSSHDIIQRTFFFGPKELQVLQSQLAPHQITSSISQVVTACIFRCRVASLDLACNEPVRISYIHNIRSRVSWVSDGYYGNAFIYPAGVGEAGWVCENSNSRLMNALDLVRKAKSQVSEEYVRSLADFLVINGRRSFMFDSLYMVSDLCNLPIHELDFGWGSSVFCGPASSKSFITFMGRFRNSKEEDGIVASICLPTSAMKKFGEELRTMTQCVEPFMFSRY